MHNNQQNRNSRDKLMVIMLNLIFFSQYNNSFTMLRSVLNCWDNEMFENLCSPDVEEMCYFKLDIIL